MEIGHSGYPLKRDESVCRQAPTEVEDLLRKARTPLPTVQESYQHNKDHYSVWQQKGMQ